MDERKVEESEMLDRFSELPDSIIDIILSRVPLRDAVRTSILSTKWRFHWTRTENLVLDDLFFRELLYDGLGDERQTMVAYVGIVNDILASHNGPLRKFFLHIPVIEFSPFMDVLNSWILSVWQRGVQDLALEYEEGHMVASFVFQCMGLKHLMLSGGIFPRNNLIKLSSLLSLDIRRVLVHGDVLTNILLNCPLLERFSLDCFYIKCKHGPFVVSAPKLKILHYKFGNYVDIILKSTPNLSTILLESEMYIKKSRNNRCQNILDFFGAVPRIESISLNGAGVLEDWGKKYVPERLPIPLENLLSLTVHTFSVYSNAQIRSMFCLMKSSLKLQTLDITIDALGIRFHGTGDYLRSQIKEQNNLWSLRIVKIALLNGEEPEMLLIEYFLSCCPMLEKIYLCSSSHLTADAASKMRTDLLWFHRASSLVEIIYPKSQ